MPLPTDLISPKAAAKLLACHVSTVYRYLHDGTLPAYRRAGQRLLVRRADAEALLEPVQVVRVEGPKATERREDEARERLRARGFRV